MANIFTNIHDALQYDFVRTALAAGTVCALLAAAVGYFVVLRQMAFAGHALGHIGFAGAWSLAGDRCPACWSSTSSPRRAWDFSANACRKATSLSA
jgi:hypothetical protein